MGMIADSMVDERVNSLPKPDGIYHIIEKKMGDRDLQERISAVIVLGNSRDPRAVKSLIDCCRDRNPEDQAPCNRRVAKSEKRQVG